MKDMKKMQDGADFIFFLFSCLPVKNPLHPIPLIEKIS